ncbi:MAG: hypothetical protein H6760_03145 [Candidatus Nomurabacteria bacterium]|nr:MAG: hypothetical protein H6760_03145 [Candidatus Nomurabacteria bacterium]
MNKKPFVMIGAILGTTIGGAIPGLWGVSWLSFTATVFSGIGGILGIWAGYKIASRYF